METGVDIIQESGVSLYPISVEWTPPFSMLVPLKVCALLSTEQKFCHGM